LPSVRLEHPTKIFLIKKIGKTFAVVLAAGKEIQKKNLNSLSGASDMAPGSQQRLLSVPDKKLPTKTPLPGRFLPEALCRVLHPAKALPGVLGTLLDAFCTRQSA